MRFPYCLPWRGVAHAIPSSRDACQIVCRAPVDGGMQRQHRPRHAAVGQRPLAHGAVPTDLTVTTASGVEHWKGVEMLRVGPTGTFLDSDYVVVAYRDPDAHTLLFGSFANDGSAKAALLVTNDTVGVFQDHTTGVTARTALGGGCATPPVRLRNPSVTPFAGAQCSAATFTTSLTLSLLSIPGADSASVVLSFSAASFSGIRVASPPATMRRVRALLEQLEQKKRLRAVASAPTARSRASVGAAPRPRGARAPGNSRRAPPG